MDKCIMDYEQMVIREIENCVNKGELNPNDVKNVGEAVDILKDLYTIDAMKRSDYGSETREYSEMRPVDQMEPRYGYSNRMYDDYDRRSSYRYGGRLNRGYSRDDMRDVW